MTGVVIPGLSGTLLSPRAARDWLASGEGRHTRAAANGTSGADGIAAWAARTSTTLGPSASCRRLLEALQDVFEQPLGFACRGAGEHAVALSPSGEAALLVAFPWGRPLALDTRRVLRAALEAGAPWAAGFNGVCLAVMDARPGSPRRTACIALDDLAAHADTAGFAAAILASEAWARGALADAIASSDRSAIEVQQHLREGVQTSIHALARELPFDASLGVVFRLLFVLFAEARALVPVWHRVYRDHYSLTSVATRWPPRDPRGAWASLEAGRRLLGEGCRAGTLQVAGFNGRLFAPGPRRKWAASPLLDSKLDRPASEALASLTEYRPARGGARRVSYAELDVEELGSIYERVLDLDPDAAGRARKESGSFYTPRSLTAFIVRRALSPLVAGASSGRILSLRVLDPAMGSGAFLVAALRFLTGALERALVEEGQLPEHDVTDADRQQLRRQVAQQCLYGVDANPTAALLAQLSLWLATLSAGRPLSFLDHRLRCGNSLIGIDPAAARHAPRVAGRGPALPLFDAHASDEAVRAGAARACDLARMREENLEDVRRKQRLFAALRADTAGLSRWRVLCDIWCAWWFVPAASRADAREYRALADRLVLRSRVIGARAAGRRLREAAAHAGSLRFFHWPLEFPDVFGGDAPGFDAVVGNPPWEMLRAGAGSDSRHAMNTFARGSGLYPRSARGHVNLYQLFLERSLQLTRPGGRIGLVLPWGLMTDDGSAGLRQTLLDGTRIDTLARFDNRDGIFQAHRSLRFAAVTATTGEMSQAFELTRIAHAAALDDLPDAGAPRSGPLITREALQAIGGSSRRVPDAASAAHLALAMKLCGRHQALGDPRGWGASFGRELNLTDDRGAFSARGSLPVLEGKHLHPHHVDVASARHRISRAAASRLLPDLPFDRARLAYRDVTAPTNTQTLIAAIVPAGAVTSHSLFCLRNAWDLRTQGALALILNSDVANFLVRLFVGSHVTTSLIEWLPVPDMEASVAELSGLDAGSAGRVIARLYGLTEDERAAI